MMPRERHEDPLLRNIQRDQRWWRHMCFHMKHHSFRMKRKHKRPKRWKRRTGQIFNSELVLKIKELHSKTYSKHFGLVGAVNGSRICLRWFEKANWWLSPQKYPVFISKSIFLVAKTFSLTEQAPLVQARIEPVCCQVHFQFKLNDSN